MAAGKAIYGTRAVSEALRTPDRVNRVFFAKESRAREAKALLDAVRQSGIRFDFVPQAKLNELANSREHQGVVAVMSPVSYASLDDCIAACGQRALFLALDQVQHPKNLGLLIRTAYGAGAAGILVPTRGSALLDDEVVRSSAGTAFHLPVIQCANLSQTLRTLKDCGFWIYGLEAQGATSVFEADWPPRLVFVLGNETKGIRPGVRKNCDAFVGIPLAHGLDSLNVSIAAGIALFQAAHAIAAKESGANG